MKAKPEAGVTRIITKGIDEVIRSFGNIEIEMKTMTKLHRIINNIIMPVAKRNAPIKTGATKRNLRASARKHTSTFYVGGGIVYANPVHWGWKTRKIQPNYWLTDAATHSETEWNKAAADYLQKILDKAQK